MRIVICSKEPWLTDLVPMTESPTGVPRRDTAYNSATTSPYNRWAGGLVGRRGVSREQINSVAAKHATLGELLKLDIRNNDGVLASYAKRRSCAAKPALSIAHVRLSRVPCRDLCGEASTALCTRALLLFLSRCGRVLVC